MQTKNVVFADLDGTFLDHKYSCRETLPIVQKLSVGGTAVVFCSSKTAAEIEVYRKAVCLNEPFISENGAAIFIPKGYFPFKYSSTKTASYNIIRLGASYSVLRKKLSAVGQKTEATLVGFGDMTDEELARDADLTLTFAKLAKHREHDEPFRIEKGKTKDVLRAIEDEGLHCSAGGRYFHLTGNHDKGKAVTILKNLYAQLFGKIATFAVGDGQNDLPMLKVVDKPLLIKKSLSANARLNAWHSILQQTV